MRRSKIKNVNVHIVAYKDCPSVQDKINELYANSIKFRLDDLNLSAGQKKKVIDMVIQKMKAK